MSLDFQRNPKGKFERTMGSVDSGASPDEVGLARKLDHDDGKVRRVSIFDDGNLTGENLQELYRQVGPKPNIASQEYVRGGGVDLVRKSLNNNLTFDGKKPDSGKPGVNRSISMESAGFKYPTTTHPRHCKTPHNFKKIQQKFSFNPKTHNLIGTPINLNNPSHPSHPQNPQNPNKTYSHNPPSRHPQSPNNNCSEQNRLSSRKKKSNSQSKIKSPSPTYLLKKFQQTPIKKLGSDKGDLADLLVQRVADCEKRVDYIAGQSRGGKLLMTPSRCKLKL